MRLYRPWYLMRCLYPGAVFRVKTPEKILCLTFDDGPDPGSTPVILRILEKHNISAVFFCSGSKAEIHPDLVSSIRENGHIVGNHGYSHLNGWRTQTGIYLEDIRKADSVTSPEIFRPPYGRITLRQYSALRKKYEIYFWDLMPYDFDDSLSSEKILKVLKKKIRPGSIIVFHDTAGSKSSEVLQTFIEYALDMKYKFGPLIH